MSKEIKLYKEVVESTGKVLTPDEQTNPNIMLSVVSTKCVEASPDEINNAKEFHKTNGKCDVHLFYDEPTFLYYNRICGICGSHLALI